MNGAVWPKTLILKGVDVFFHFYSFTIRKRSLCRCLSMEVSPLNQKLKARIFHFNCIFTTVSISLFHEIRNGGLGVKLPDLSCVENLRCLKVFSFILCI